MALVDCDLTLPFFSHAHANGDDVSRACIGGGGNRHSQAFEEQLTRPLASCEPDELLRSRAAALSPRGRGSPIIAEHTLRKMGHWHCEMRTA